MKLIATLGIVLLTCGCGKDKDRDDGAKKPDPTAHKASDKPAEPEKLKAPPAPPRDPELVELLKAGTDCTWDKYGMTRCESAEKMRKLAFNKQSNRTLAKSCAGALRDAEASSRGLAAICLKNFNERTQTPHLGALLDAFEAEKDPMLRTVLACATSRNNAKAAGVEDRVIGLVRKVAGEPDSDMRAGCLFASMFPAYLMARSDPPSRAAGDLALEFLHKTGHARERALEAVAQMTDRVPDACAALGQFVATDDWAPAVTAMAKLGDACTDSFEQIVATMARAMTDNKYKTRQYSATRAFLRGATLDKKQLGKLRKASKKLAKSAKAPWTKSAKEIVDLLKNYKPPASGK